MLKDGEKVKLTLDQTWEECLKMWKWIVEQGEKDSPAPVWLLKRQWMVKNGWSDVMETCFFCEYAMTQTEQNAINEDEDESDYDCNLCPGRLVDEGFYCANIEYHYYAHPKRFLEKLLELDAKRRGTTR